MKKLQLITLLIGMLFVACEDDFDNPNPNKPIDNYIGDLKTFELGVEAENFHFNDTTECFMLTKDDIEISRKCITTKSDGKTIVKLEEGLADGIYRLLYFEYKIEAANSEEEITRQFGLGCRIEIYKKNVRIIDSFDKTLQMTGSGTAEDPYIVTCGPHLYNLTLGVQDFYQYDKFNGAYFKQVADISLHDASYYCKHENGWTPIGNVAYPFVGTYDGGGHKIKNMYSHHDQLCGVGLFGHITNSTIQNLTIANADISGAVGVGGIAGCLMTLSGERTSSSIINCKVVNSKIKADNNGFAVGGVVGLIDMTTVGLIEQCESDNNVINAEYNAGGIVGSSSAYSLTSIDLCKNSSTVTTNYAGAGGIIGVADTLSVTTSVNTGAIEGAIKYAGDSGSSIGRGSGGICGGSGVSWISGCENSGAITGYEGVGGIIGSTRVAYSADNGAIYNNTYLRYCKNAGNISGSSSHVGGLCGEGQLGCFGSLNTGEVKGRDHVGGIAGHTSLSVIHNTINNGAIKGNNYVAGISALSNSGVYAGCQNYGVITASGSNAAGIVGLSGNNTMVHYCSNYSPISGGNTPIGGIVGEFGDPREWSDLNICEIVFGSAEIILSFLGPVCAVVEEAVEMGNAAKHIMLAVEVGIESIMKIPSITLWSFGIDHLKNPHHVEALETDIKADLSNRVDNLIAEINNIRSTYNFAEIPSFSSQAFVEHSNNNIALSDYLTTLASEGKEENAKLFNKQINKTMQERAEKINKENENKEIALSVLEGISLVATTVCTIGAAVAGVVATGGVAAAFIIPGTVMGILGGACSISKGAADYTDNVVIISQCVNANTISCNNINKYAMGGIVGKLHDRGVVKDCLNTGIVNADCGHIVGNTGQNVDISNCLTLADTKPHYMISIFGANSSLDNLYYYTSHNLVSYPYGIQLSINEISNPKSYDGWDIGNTSELWTIPSLSSGNSFPIPFTSEMTKQST